MRFLSFQLADEYFGVPLEQVQEVIAFPNFTAIPGAPSHCLGIMSLRDQIIPIVDLRIKFQIEPTLDHDTSVIICNLKNMVVGVVVDMIHTVIAPTESEVVRVPDGVLSESKSSNLVAQVVRKDGKLTVTLNMENLINSSEQELMKLHEAHQTLKPVA